MEDRRGAGDPTQSGREADGSLDCGTGRATVPAGQKAASGWITMMRCPSWGGQIRASCGWRDPAVGASRLGMHRRFSWVALTKCRCSEIVLGEASTGYGKLLTRLTAQRKPSETAIIRASCARRDAAVTAGVCHLGAKRWGRPGPSLRLSLR